MNTAIFVSHISQTQLSKLDSQMEMSALAIDSYNINNLHETFLNDDTENENYTKTKDILCCFSYLDWIGSPYGLLWIFIPLLI